MSTMHETGEANAKLNLWHFEADSKFCSAVFLAGIGAGGGRAFTASAERSWRAGAGTALLMALPTTPKPELAASAPACTKPKFNCMSLQYSERGPCCNVNEIQTNLGAVCHSAADGLSSIHSDASSLQELL